MKNVPKKIEIMVVFGILMSHAYTSFLNSRNAFNLARLDRFDDEDQCNVSSSEYKTHV